MKKLLWEHRTILSFLVLKFPQIQPRKDNFLLYPHSKVIGLTNYELKNLELTIESSRILLEM